jgi:uncharacterized protein
LPSPDNPQLEPQTPLTHESMLSVSSPPHTAFPGEAPAFFSPPRPEEDPVWSGWDVLLVAFLIAILTVVVQTAVGWIAQTLFYPRLGLLEVLQKQPTLLLVSQFLSDAAWAVLIFLVIEGKYETRFPDAIRWNWPRSAGIMFALGAVTFVGLAVLGSHLPMPKETPFDKLFDRPRDAYLLAFFAVTLGPLVEELFFRGFLYPVIARRWGAAWGIALAALPFALLHLQQYAFSLGIIVIIFAVGVVCGIVRAATKSVAASFLVHAGYNGAQMLIAVVLSHGFTRTPKGLAVFAETLRLFPR